MSPTEAPIALLRSKVAEASRFLQEAETDLAREVGDLAPVQAGDKQVGTKGLERSFQRLVAARRALADLEELLAAAALA